MGGSYTESNVEKGEVHRGDEINIKEIFSVLSAGKWFILITTLIFSVTGIAYVLVKPNIYEANVLLAPANDESVVNGIGDQLGGLASLAGLNVRNNGANQTLIAIEVLKSRAFLSDFIRRRQLEVPLLGTTAWDEESRAWVYDRDVYNPVSGDWLADEQGRSYKPTAWDLVKAFKEDHLTVSEKKESSMIVLSVRSVSPTAAQRWAQWLVADINERMRQKDVSEASARIEYLEEKLSETNVAGMQRVFYQLIENETRTVMLANAKQEYVFMTVDPAVVPQERIEPKRGLIIALAAILGVVSGALIILLRFFLSEARQNEKMSG